MSRRKSVSKQKIVLYGVTGMLGTRFFQLPPQQFKIIAPPHSHLDLTDRKKVLEHLSDIRPDRIVYAAGITKVDYAQNHPKESFLLNHEIPAFIAERSANMKIPLTYISTDAVFNGQSTKSYKENDKTDPLSVYGKSKLKGENAVLSSSSGNTVVRTIMIYSSNFSSKKDFARTALESLKNNLPFEGIVDQFVNPTFVDDIVKAIEALIKKEAKGIYHVAARDFTTNYGFVEKIADLFKLNKSLISKVTFDEFFKGKPAPRARYCVLSTTKFQKEFGNGIIHSIDQSLRLFKNQLQKVEPLPIDV